VVISFEAGSWLSFLVGPPVACLSAAEAFLGADLRFFCTFAAACSVVSQPLRPFFSGAIVICSELFQMRPVGKGELRCEGAIQHMSASNLSPETHTEVEFGLTRPHISDDGGVQPV
jgi:hypothetical protein